MLLVRSCDLFGDKEPCVFRCAAPAAHFFILGGKTLEKEYFIDILFDLINESEALEMELQDLQVHRNVMSVTMKDGTTFTVVIS